MPDGTAFARGRMMPMDVEGGPTQLAEIEAAATGGRPRAPVERDGTPALLVDGAAGPALLGCSPTWPQEPARTTAAAADDMERGAGHA